MSFEPAATDISYWLDGLTWLVDAVMALTLLELVLLGIYHRKTGRGVPASELALNMLSGLALMLALRLALAGTAAWAIMAALAAAGILHASDLWRRWRR